MGEEGGVHCTLNISSPISVRVGRAESDIGAIRREERSH